MTSETPTIRLLTEQFGVRVVEYRFRREREDALDLLFSNGPRRTLDFDLLPCELSEAKCACKVGVGYIGIRL